MPKADDFVKYQELANLDMVRQQEHARRLDNGAIKEVMELRAW